MPPPARPPPTPTSRSTARPGKRGKRGGRAEELLIALTGAEDALVVNNCAAALMLALASLAKRKEVLVSRGELIEIGGEFRIPDIMAASGAKLVEVGTTNRTRIGDYRAAASETNRRDPEGASVELPRGRLHGRGEREGSRRARRQARRAVPVRRGLRAARARPRSCRPTSRAWPTRSPTVPDSSCARATSCSAARRPGSLVGRADLVDRLRRHPVARAVRIDAMQVAALESVLSMYATGRDEGIPVHRMLRETADSVHHRAQALCEEIGGDLEGAHVHKCHSVVGGGSTPGASLPSCGIRVRSPIRPASRRDSASARRRSSAASRTTPCCWTSARSCPPRNPTSPARSSTRSRATTSSRTSGDRAPRRRHRRPRRPRQVVADRPPHRHGPRPVGGGEAARPHDRPGVRLV